MGGNWADDVGNGDLRALSDCLSTMRAAGARVVGKLERRVGGGPVIDMRFCDDMRREPLLSVSGGRGRAAGAGDAVVASLTVTEGSIALIPSHAALCMRTGEPSWPGISLASKISRPVRENSLRATS